MKIRVLVEAIEDDTTTTLVDEKFDKEKVTYVIDRPLQNRFKPGSWIPVGVRQTRNTHMVINCEHDDADKFNAEEEKRIRGQFNKGSLEDPSLGSCLKLRALI
jgi:hypothetical protein